MCLYAIHNQPYALYHHNFLLMHKPTIIDTKDMMVVLVNNRFTVLCTLHIRFVNVLWMTIKVNSTRWSHNTE